MEATFSDQIPLSGDFEEVCFDCHCNDTWVRFLDSENQAWYGIFGRGLSRTSQVLLMRGGPLCFVLSGGQGYWIDINRRNLISKTEDDYLENVTDVPGRELVVCSNFTNILFSTPDGLIWDSGRVSMDGISFEEITNNQIKGRINDLSEEGAPYVLQIDQPDFSCKWKYQV
ncbi:MAG: hypothetical protein ABIK07_08220 [Planctomycetota bacterium]